MDPVRSQDPSDPQSWNRYIGIGVASLKANISEGNVRGALLDTAGLIGDSITATVPGLPGGFATAISPRTKTVSGPLQDKIEASGDNIFIFDPNTGKFAEAAITGNKITGAIRPPT